MLLLAIGELCDVCRYCTVKVKVMKFHPKTCHEDMGGGVGVGGARCIGLTNFSSSWIAYSV